jgi:hypothetical protein
MRLNLKTAPLLIASIALSTGAGDVFAHDGHGMSGSHWHATDVLGFIALACVIGLIHWLANRDE